MMIDLEKIYLCSLLNPRMAADLYDIAIIQAKGQAAKVNFIYEKAHLLAILFE
jgi:hypothetical protein